MPFGFDVWDLLGQGGYDPNEEERQRMMAEASAPVSSPADDVAELQLLEGQPQPPTEGAGPVINAPQVRGAASPELSAIFRQYQDWMGRRPTRESVKPSTGRRIAAGLAGFLVGLKDPRLGIQLSSGIANQPYDQAMEQWQGEGKALGEVGKFGQDIEETKRKREATATGFEETRQRIDATMKGVEQRRDAENQRHQDRLAGITDDNLRRAEIARHNKALEGLAREANKIRGQEAAARTTTANAYAERVGQLGEDVKQPKPLPAHYRAAVMDSIGEMLVKYPDYSKYFIRDPRNKSIIMPKPGMNLAPVDAQRLMAFLADAKKNARLNLGMPPEGGPNDVEDYNPLRQEVP